MPRKQPSAPPGFPWKGRFTTMGEIKEYFDHEQLACLLCGREYGNLGLHVSRTHKIHIDDYKEMFGIPWS